MHANECINAVCILSVDISSTVCLYMSYFLIYLLISSVLQSSELSTAYIGSYLLRKYLRLKIISD